MRFKRLEKIAIWSLCTIGFCGCVHKWETTNEKITHDEAKHLEEDELLKNEHKQIIETLKVSPSEVITRKFDPPPAPTKENPHPAPILTEEKIEKIGGSVSTTATDVSEQTKGIVKIDDSKKGGTEEKQKKTGDTHPALSCVAGGSLWAVALILALFLGLKIMIRRSTP